MESDGAAVSDDPAMATAAGLGRADCFRACRDVRRGIGRSVEGKRHESSEGAPEFDGTSISRVQLERLSVARPNASRMHGSTVPLGEVTMTSLAPALLLSMPQMADPNFARAVVLLCKHNHEGAFGLIMNRPLVTTGRVVVSLDPPVSTDRELEVWVGGPVEPGSSWILVGGQPEKDQRDADRRRFVAVDVAGSAPAASRTQSSREHASHRRLLRLGARTTRDGARRIGVVAERRRSRRCSFRHRPIRCGRKPSAGSARIRRRCRCRGECIRQGSGGRGQGLGARGQGQGVRVVAHSRNLCPR